MLDVRIPELVRTATLKLIQSRCSALPVTTITGHADVPMAVQAMKSGAADFIDKLVINETLIDSIQAVPERSRRDAGDMALAQLIRERFATLNPDELAATPSSATVSPARSSLQLSAFPYGP